MSTDKPDIGIIYGKGILSCTSNHFRCQLLSKVVRLSMIKQILLHNLSGLANEFAAYGLRLAAEERSPFINAAVDFFIPFLQIMLSPEMVSALSQGLLSSLITNEVYLFSIVRILI